MRIIAFILEPPTGADGILSDSRDLDAGFYVTGWVGKWSVDLYLVYGAQGFAGVAVGLRRMY